MKKTNKNAFFTILRKAEAAMKDGEPVYYMDSKQYVDAQIIQIDQENKEFTFLLRIGKHAMKWVSWDRIAFTVKEN